MPFISIIIPTYNNEEHIEQAIDSCFDSDFDDFEIIVINDASTDGTAAKLELLVERYAGKIKINHSEKNIGPGPARNIGLEQAKGEYIMFLDGDDWFEPDAVKTVAEKLKEVEPDVLMFNHQRVWENGIIIPNLPNKYVTLEMKEQDISKHELRNKIVRNLFTASNKTYKKTYISETDCKFPTGLYEDIYWSIKSFIFAKKAYYIPAIIFNYRQRPGSITRSSDKKHFNILIQYKNVTTLLNKHDKLKKYYGKNIYESAKAQIFGVIRVGYRIPKNLEKNFMRSSYHFLKMWRAELSIKKIDIGLVALGIGNRKVFMATQPKIKQYNAHK